MSLSPSQIENFKTHGYTIVPDFFSAEEIAALRRDLARLRAEGKLRNVRPPVEGADPEKVKANLQLVPIAPHSALIRALPFAPKVTEAVQALIGENLILHLDQTFVKPGLRGTGTNWHQDNAYFRIADPMQGTAMWIAVNDATIANGTMRVLPDMYNEQLPHEKDPESDHHIRCYPENERESIPFEIEAGGVAFFCYGTPHCTMANNTVEDRAGIAMHFLTYEAAASAEGGGAEAFSNEDRDNRPYLTGPKATGGEKEYGQCQVGRWEALVAGEATS